MPPFMSFGVESGHRHHLQAAMPTPPSALRPYDPLNRCKPVAADVWVVDGAEVRMAYFGLRLPFLTRMTVVRLPDGALWVHSPTEPAAELLAALAGLGRVRFLVSPNRLHTTWMAEWRSRFPAAVTAGFARWRSWGGARQDYAVDLEGGGPFGWEPAITQVIVPGSMFAQAVFFHRPSRTLIVTDLLQNAERERIGPRWLRVLLGVTGPLYPEATAPPDVRLTFWPHRAAVREAVARMKAWAPERVIFAHGRTPPGEAGTVLERAFRWVG